MNNKSRWTDPAIIVVLVFQIAAFIWYGGAMAERVNQVTVAVHTLEHRFDSFLEARAK